MKPMTPERIDEVRHLYNAALKLPLPEVRTILYIQFIDGPLLGWVCQYHLAEHSTSVGISICESGYWGRGICTEAMLLWIGYLFANLELDEINTSMWSGNLRMMRCAEKCGFKLVERVPNCREVRGQLYDGLNFTLSRAEWQMGRTK